jgi:hypothetical protein
MSNRALLLMALAVGWSLIDYPVGLSFLVLGGCLHAAFAELASITAALRSH